jgi:hypothetical protein
MVIQPTQTSATNPAERLSGDASYSEPSHVHIPRPSRVGQSIASHRNDGDAIQAQLALEEAA